MRQGHRNPFEMQGGPSVALAELYERVSRTGRRYLVGRIGMAKIMIVVTTHYGI